MGPSEWPLSPRYVWIAVLGRLSKGGEVWRNIPDPGVTTNTPLENEEANALAGSILNVGKIGCGFTTEAKNSCKEHLASDEIAAVSECANSVTL